MFNILSNEHMEVGGNVCFDYFTNVFKIHFGEICHLAITAVKFHNEDRSHVPWYARATSNKCSC